MPKKNHATSITFKTQQGPVTFYQSNPLPPESVFHGKAAIKAPTTNVRPRKRRKRRRWNMFLQKVFGVKEEEKKPTVAIKTGKRSQKDVERIHSQGKRKSVIGRMKGLLKGGHPRNGEPQQAISSIEKEDETVEAITSSRPIAMPRDSFEPSPIDGVTTNQYRAINQRAQDLISTSPQEDYFNIKACASSENQQDGNIALTQGDFTGLKTCSVEDLVDIVWDFGFGEFYGSDDYGGVDRRRLSRYGRSMQVSNMSGIKDRQSDDLNKLDFKPLAGGTSTSDVRQGKTVERTRPNSDTAFDSIDTKASIPSRSTDNITEVPAADNNPKKQLSPGISGQTNNSGTLTVFPTQHKPVDLATVPFSKDRIAVENNVNESKHSELSATVPSNAKSAFYVDRGLELGKNVNSFDDFSPDAPSRATTFSIQRGHLEHSFNDSKISQSSSMVILTRPTDESPTLRARYLAGEDDLRRSAAHQDAQTSFPFAIAPSQNVLPESSHTSGNGQLLISKIRQKQERETTVTNHNDVPNVEDVPFKVMMPGRYPSVSSVTSFGSSEAL